MTKILKGWFKWFIVALYVLCGGASIFGMMQTTINYDLSKYLPGNSVTKQSIEVIKDEFGLTSAIQVMTEEVSLLEAKALKERFKEIPEVKLVVWLDDVADITKPLSSYDSSLVEAYYKDGCALYTITFLTDDYDKATERGIDQIKVILADYEKSSMRGDAVSNIETRRLTQNEIVKIIIIIVPIAILILLFASTTWFEPVIILLSLGLAVLFNMGTNFIFPSVSFITFSISAILQLAISLDYSLFLIHRFYEERQNGLEVVPAVVKALKTSFGSITASAMTTVAGFLSLLLMRYTIGMDIGIVMAKGVLFSYISCLTILPVFIVIFSKLLEKTKHRKLLPSFETSAAIIHRGRYVAIAAIVVMAIGGFILQSRTVYYYGNNSASNAEGSIAEERQNITERFGEWSPIVILVPNDSPAKEAILIEELSNHEHVTGVQALYAFVDPGTPLFLLPEELVNQFRSEHYSQIILNSDLVIENNELYEFSCDIQDIVRGYYPDYFIASATTSTTDIQKAVSFDSLIVSIVSIVSVGLILVFLFRQMTLPVILIGIIQTSIWINFAIPYLQGVTLAYIGFLVVSGLQLGATIDYAVLVGSRYKEFRKDHDAIVSMKKAVIASSASVLVSTLILTAAGLVLGMFSSMGAIKEMGMLIGRGAALSGGLVLFLLGPILVLFDKQIMKERKRKKAKT